ncbi:MAG TPA: AIR synthase-related protein, partial [Candidatus Hydrogenedentes bacterium]|nr:AIR synthase-related protein [Candidatus Hydrogenedentota bacterium]
MRTDRIEVGVKPELTDPAGVSLVSRLRDDLGIHVEAARVFDVYTLRGDFTDEELERARAELFTDPVIQVSAVNCHLATDWDAVVEVGFLPGVTDNVGKSALEGLRDLLRRELPEEARVFKSTLYAFRGIDRDTAERIAEAALANPLIEQWRTLDREALRASGGRPLLALPLVHIPPAAAVETLSLDLDDAALLALSRDRMLALDLREMRAIQAHYAHPETRARRAALGMPADPTDVEIECIAQTWSEHCKHKIFSALIRYTAPDGTTREIDGLFKTYIRGATEAVAPTVDWLVSVFEDNAGIIRFDENHLFALKCETHNSPSALDPYGGAMTGIVGVNRDVLGAGLGFQCIFNTDVFCFASPFYEGELPPRLLHPRRVLRGVHAGVRDGGNQSGIPDINGAIVFHERFLGKPLVFCGTGGLAPVTAAGKPVHEKAARPGDLIVMTGGRIGKDGIHGATFSSEELHEGSPATAVQIGDPITQKKMADFLLEARDLGLYTCITDNGAGGLSSSVGEMARKPGGAVLHLDRAPLKYPGLAPWEI